MAQKLLINDNTTSRALLLDAACFFKINFFSESLRKYPPVPFLDRRCKSDYRIPGSNLVIEKGVCIYISLLGLHNDETFFPDPERFIPERHQDSKFTDQLTLAPFGYGPRICIGKSLDVLSKST